MKTTISKLARLVLRSIGGGVITADLDPQQPTVEYYVGLALKYVFVEDYRRNRREEAMLEGSVDITTFVDRQFLVQYEKDVQIDDEEKFVDIPKPMAISNNRWLDRVFVNRRNGFVLLKTPDEVRSVEDELDVTFAYPENNRIYFINLSPLVGKVKVIMVPDPSSLESDESVSLPPGLEVKVVEMATAFFRGTRDIPKDLLNDNIDT